MKDCTDKRNDFARERTRLANKRTFLAWCRTALAVMGFGFLLEKMDIFLAAGFAAVSRSLVDGLGLLGRFSFFAGPLLVLFAAWDYYRLERQIGFSDEIWYVVPELVLVCVILGTMLIYFLT